MDNAVALPPNASQVPATFAGRLQAMPLRSKISALVGVVALAGVVFAMTAWGSHGDYKVLYANLSDKDGGAVIAQLSQMNVPYRLSEGGAAILVPAAQVHDLRLKMATAGLPKGADTGFELMDSARFGQTQFQERLTFQRGLEGELTRSITSLGALDVRRTSASRAIRAHVSVASLGDTRSTSGGTCVLSGTAWMTISLRWYRCARSIALAKTASARDELSRPTTIGFMESLRACAG